MDRKLVLPVFRDLETVRIEHIEAQDIQDVMQVLLSQCGSSFERTVLEKLSNEGIPLPNAAQKIVYDGDIPIAKPDFFYEIQNIAVFVDGPPHERDYVQRDDEVKRNKLREMGYRVFEIRYDNVDEDIENLKRILTI